MAINFSASFAACLAAGLKVPRQFMYCIAQDAGAPYVVYKDGHGGGNGTVPVSLAGGGVGGGGGGGGGASANPPAQNGNPTPAPQNGNGGPEWNEPFPSSPQESATPIQQPSPSPPYPQQQHTPANSLPVSVEEEATNGGDHENNTQEDMPCDMGPGSGGGGGGGYYPGPPRHHVLSPTAFMSYLKQPMVLTSLNSGDQVSDFHSVFRPGMPDLLGGGLKGAPNGPNSVQSMGGKSCELRLFKCLTCGKDFKQKSTLLQHERIHTDSRPYGCTECGKRFRQQSHLTQHLRIHANEKPFACVYCERTFRQRAILNQHLRIHSDFGSSNKSRPNQKIQFDSTPKKRESRVPLNGKDVSPHLLYKNGQLWPQDVPFPQQDNKDGLLGLAHHQGFDGQHDPGAQCFPDGTINQFPAYFKDAKGVAHGIIGQNGKGIPEMIQSGRQAGMPLYVRCPICQKEFKQKSTLLQHGCIHIESRPYPCAECGKRFRQQSHLTQHLRIHTNEKPYGCLYCGRNFRQRTILNQHVRIHTGEKPYKCSQCGKDFRQKAILDQHTRTHQGDRPYCCPMANCRRRFASEPELKRHVDNHMNPHAGKRRTLSHPQPVVKPELYLPQCYTPAAAAAAFQQQYSMSQLLQPPPQSTALVQ
ncbi:zinc finger protein 502-like isoform X2 [Cimex lectularius]|uniref:C2H2-type domain-containing protein n=1 Tax=Cimex lectularius TaxID=79782 RepID=A0A8I6TE80_CIMLE|nr:zinc finger protein 502-like isoform X2 [Cimex lectularius]